MGNIFRRWICVMLFATGLFSSWNAYCSEQSKATTAVVNFTVDRSVKADLTGASIAVKLEQALGNKYRLVTRSQVSKALKELRFQNSDLVSRSNAKKIGKMLGAEYLITGSVVQIGEEITLACQRFSIKSGVIKQTAEVSVSSVEDFNYMIRKAAVILSMNAAAKRKYIDEKFNYPKHIEAGKKAFVSEEYINAVRHFKKAKSARRTNVVDILLKSAEAKVKEQRILNERKIQYELAMNLGNKLLNKHEWKAAENAFKEALQITRYEYDAKASEGLKTAQGGVEGLRKHQLKEKFFLLLNAANKKLASQDWAEAEVAYKLALKTEGYECNELAIEGIKNARGGAELMSKRNAASSAYRSIMLKVNQIFKKAISSGYKTQNFGALCDAGQSKLYSLEKSSHWIYISKASQKKVEALQERLKCLKADYAQKNLTWRAEKEYANAYAQAVKLYRDGRLLDSKSQQAYDKCTETCQTISAFIRSSHYRHVDNKAKQRFSVLREKVVKYIKTLVPPFPNDLKRVKNPEYVIWLTATSGTQNARDKQIDWVIKFNLPLEVKSKMTGIEFRLIPPGHFLMGSPSSEKERYSNETQHYVTLTEAFYCGKFEITQEQWQRVMGNNPSHFKKAGATAPVDSVSWNDCQKFLDKLCALEGIPRGSYCLLTEAQWEYACRAGTKTTFYFGNSLNSKLANFDASKQAKGSYRKTTVPVGSFKPNAFGLYDMHGNIYEWCNDRFANYNSSSKTDPTGPSFYKRYRVARGGSWSSFTCGCRSARRNNRLPTLDLNTLGLRIMRKIPKRLQN